MKRYGIKVVRWGTPTAVIEIILLVGCTVPSTYQSPKVLEQGEKAIGTGISFARVEGIIPIDFCLYGRIGVSKRIDMGIQMFALPRISYFEFSDPFEGYDLFLDLKYSFVENPRLVSGDIGIMRYANYFVPDHEYDGFGVYPLILVGGKRIYGGIGWNLTFERDKHWRMEKDDPYVSTSTHTFGKAVVGTSIEKGRLRIHPELSLYSKIPFGDPDEFDDTGPLITAGLGIYYVFPKREKD